MEDKVNHPKHYTSHPSGIECIDVVEHMGFCIGNAVKYLWRCGLKSQDTHVEDMKKAVWYINREIDRLLQKEKKEKSTSFKLNWGQYSDSWHEPGRPFKPCPFCDCVVCICDQQN